MTTPLILDFGPRFCQIHIDRFLGRTSLIAPYTPDQFLNSLFNLSLQPDTSLVHFNLALTGWIATEEVVFLFGWIRKLVSEKKQVSVALPYSQKLSSLYTSEQLKAIAQRYEFVDSEASARKRRNRNLFLMLNWGMLKTVNLPADAFSNMLGSAAYSKRADELFDDDFNKILPFTGISTAHDGEVAKYDEFFRSLIGGKVGKNGVSLFDIEQKISKILEQHACYSPFETRILSNVIFREIYLNACQHSFTDQPDNREVYMAASFTAKDNSKIPVSFDRLSAERDIETLNFFKDKQKALLKITEELRHRRPKDRIIDRVARVDTITDIRQFSFVEYTIMDFGIGIHGTIEEQYTQHKEQVKRWLSTGHEHAHRDAQLIEYACLLETSSIPLDNNLDAYRFVPRGLYFMLDMVRRYKGLIKIRSGRGMVVYDFSDQIHLFSGNKSIEAELRPAYAIKECVVHSDPRRTAYFPGLMISLILPEKHETHGLYPSVTLQPVRLEGRKLDSYIQEVTGERHLKPVSFETLAPDRYEYVSLLFLFNQAIEEYIQKSHDLPHLADKEDIRERNRLFYNSVFKKISSQLDKVHEQNCVIFFDFSGFPYDTQLLKIIYYLLETPKINELTKAVIVCNDVNQTSILKNLRYQLADAQEVRALFKPIPVLSFDTSSSTTAFWLGLPDINEKQEAQLTSLLLEGKVVHTKNDFKPIIGNLLYSKDKYIYSFLSSEDRQTNLFTVFSEARTEGISKFVQQFIIDGNTPDKHGKKSIFLATNGTWQKCYLSLYEILHDKFIARYFASCLLDTFLQRYHERCRIIESTIADNITRERDLAKELLNLRFDKIVTVTVSSQLIGVAMRDLIREDLRYAILRKPNEENSLLAAPTLLILSSYYSFEGEKPFKKIRDFDNIVILNDVIATGQLIEKLDHKLRVEKSVNIKAVFSIADTRIDPIDITNEHASVHLGKTEDQLISLITQKDGIIIRKYRRSFFKPRDARGQKRTDLLIKRINPLLNSVVELKLVHSDEEKILFRDPVELIGENTFIDEVFRVGHFSQNLIHNGYMSDMQHIFSNYPNNSGEELLKKIALKLRSFESGRFNSESIIRSMVSDVYTLSKNRPEVTKEQERLLSALKEFKIKIEQSGSSSLFGFDFVFYPIFSGIEQISHQVISNVFHTPVENIIGLQRFETNKGWRFPFPPKRFNELTRGKSILILDSGSLTGESLVQLIDNITFLDVRSITVISVICRIEDFYREIYSKLKYVKVKTLNSNRHEVTGILHHEEHVIPIRILFGINLHIPVYPAVNVCPFCREVEELIKYRESESEFYASEYTSRYISSQIQNLQLTHLSLQDPYRLPDYLPLKNGRLRSIDLFLIRDRIGKIQSFRFYPEYFIFFDKLVDELDPDIFENGQTEYFEQIMAVIVHEPLLLVTVRDLLVDVYEVCTDIIKKVVLEQTIKLNSLWYDWPKHGLLRLAFIFFKQELFERNNFERLLRFAKEDTKSYDYLSFLLWKGFYKLDKDHKNCSGAYYVVMKMAKAIGGDHSVTMESFNDVYTDVRSRDIIRSITENLKNIPTTDVNQAFYNLFKFFASKTSVNTHDELSKSISRITVLIQNENLAEDEIEDIFHKTKEVFHVIKTHIYDNLMIICGDGDLRHVQMNAFEKFDSANESILNVFKKMYSEFSHLSQEFASFSDKKLAEDRLANIINAVEEFQHQHLLSHSYLQRYALRYYCDLTKCIHEAIAASTDSFKKLANFTCDISFKEPCFVTAHADLLDYAFREVIENACKNPENADTVLEWIISTTEDTASLAIRQKTPFKNPCEHKGGLYKEIIPILSLFGQADSFKMLENPFTLSVNFNRGNN